MSENKKEMLRYFEAAELDTLSPEIQERIQLAQSLFVELGRLMKSITLYGANHQSSLNFRTRFFESLSDCLARFSPFEVEGPLLEHDAVLEAAVLAHPDQDNLIKPKAFVVTAEGHADSDALEDELKTFVRGKLAEFKYPRWDEFRDKLPENENSNDK